MVMGVEGEGGEIREPSDNQLNAMKNILDNSMKAGAFGLSSGRARIGSLSLVLHQLI
jgi:N-acyl-D-aspartate/D-glutamate deacylase